MKQNKYYITKYGEQKSALYAIILMRIQALTNKIETFLFTYHNLLIMSRLNRILMLSLVSLALLSLIVLTLTLTTVWASSIPSAPQFSLKLIDNSYDEPPSTTTDSYTGVTTTKPGYHVYDRSIEITIKNQSFKSYTDTNGNKIDLYYRISFKGHFGDDTEWRTWSNPKDKYVHYISAQPNSDYTVVSVIIDYPSYPFTTMYPDGSQLDFRVEAFTGYFTEPTQADHIAGFHDPYLVSASSSGWSNIQTINITSGSSSTLFPSQTTTLPPTSTTADDTNQPQIPDQTQQPNNILTNPLFTLGIGVLLGGVVIAVVLTILKKQLRNSSKIT